MREKLREQRTGTIDLCDHVEQLGVAGLEANGAHDEAQAGDVNDTCVHGDVVRCVVWLGDIGDVAPCPFLSKSENASLKFSTIAWVNAILCCLCASSMGP
jgi:hypothetical protein